MNIENKNKKEPVRKELYNAALIHLKTDVTSLIYCLDDEHFKKLNIFDSPLVDDNTRFLIVSGESFIEKLINKQQKVIQCFDHWIWVCYEGKTEEVTEIPLIREILSEIYNIESITS